MPLPSQKYGALQCSAKSKRSGVRCLNNAVSGATICRMHGFVPKGKIKRGEQHANFLHGQRTQEAEKKHSAFCRKLSELEDAMHLLKMTTAKRSRGRKALGYRPIKSINELKKVLDEY